MTGRRNGGYPLYVERGTGLHGCGTGWRARLSRWRWLVGWHARFFWCAFLQHDFEDGPVQELVDEYLARPRGR